VEGVFVTVSIGTQIVPKGSTSFLWPKSRANSRKDSRPTSLNIAHLFLGGENVFKQITKKSQQLSNVAFIN
jgi:hypothetical protein